MDDCKEEEAFPLGKLKPSRSIVKDEASFEMCQISLLKIKGKMEYLGGSVI